MKGPKVVIIGAGSYFFGKALVWNMAKSPVLKNGTLSMVDTDPHVLDVMMRFARRVFDEMDAPVKLEGSTDRREVLADADFVIFSFSEKNAFYRDMDCKVSAKHGIRMCSGDTIGPGGIFRALREIPHALAMAEDIRELCPDAWVINYVNPASVMGIAMMRHAPDLKSFAICDGPHLPYAHLRMHKLAGLLPDDATEIPEDFAERTEIHSLGVNHFTWVCRYNFDGEDMLPRVRERLAKDAEEDNARWAEGSSDYNSFSKVMHNPAYALQLLDVFGAYPDRIAHSKEYVPYFQGYGVAPNWPEPIAIFDGVDRQEKMNEEWKVTEAWADGSRPVTEFTDNGKIDHATDIIESMWGNLGKTFIVNTANRGAVPNMADDAFLELPCKLGMDGVTPHPAMEMPRGLLGLEQQVLDSHELTVQAAVSCDRQILLQAMLVDPIINNIADARNCMEELLEAQSDVLPAGWKKDQA